MTTKRRIILGIAILAALAAAYGLGQFKATIDRSTRQMHADLEHWRQLAELDRSFLKNVVTRPSTLTSGTYVMETTFPGQQPTSSVLHLVFANGQFALPKPTTPGRAGMSDTLVQDGHVVWWLHEGIMYEADAECVGLIDGGTIWGRIYGWNPGAESIGVWRIYPKPENTGAN
jgi:hypothetical protein